MMDFLRECTTNANIVASGMMLLVSLYWLMVIFGVVGLDVFDIDVDVDADLGIDADFGVDLDVDGGVGTAPGSQLGGGNATTANESFLGSLFDFFFLGDVPIVIIGSFFVLYYWMGTFLTNHFYNPDQTLLVALFWFLPVVVVSLAVTRYSLVPVAILFRKPPPEDTTRQDMLGKIGRVTTSEVNEKFGQMMVKETNEPEVILNIRAQPGQSLGKGDAARILSYNNENGTFLVELTKWENANDDE